MTEFGVQMSILFVIIGACLVGILAALAGSSGIMLEKVEADPKDKRAGPGRSNWKHVRVCTECREITGHQEFMTSICLSCGQKMRFLPRDAAVRQIFWQGQWREQLHDHGSDYMRQADEWLPWMRDERES